MTHRHPAARFTRLSRLAGFALCVAGFALGCSPYDNGLLSGTGGSGGSGGTGGNGGGGSGGTGGGTCVPTNGGVEICDGLDNDCNGRHNDGPAAESCRATVLHAVSFCSSDGQCVRPRCDVGFYDCNSNPGDGCERPEAETPCGYCGRTCDDAGDEDAGGDGAISDAEVEDASSDAALPCVPSGAEICDGVDNDCDDMIDPDATCPTGCTGHTLSTGVYARCAPVTFGAARAACMMGALNMKMVRINTIEENAVVHTLAGTSAVWIGATDADGIAAEGAWEWTDGTQFWMGGTPANGGAVVGLAYTNWATDSAGQPDNAGSGGGEDCAEMTTTGVWNDIICSSSRVYVCERY